MLLDFSLWILPLTWKIGNESNNKIVTETELLSVYLGQSPIRFCILSLIVRVLCCCFFLGLSSLSLARWWIWGNATVYKRYTFNLLTRPFIRRRLGMGMGMCPFNSISLKMNECRKNIVLHEFSCLCSARILIGLVFSRLLARSFPLLRSVHYRNECSIFRFRFSHLLASLRSQSSTFPHFSGVTSFFLLSIVMISIMEFVDALK